MYFSGKIKILLLIVTVVLNSMKCTASIQQWSTDMVHVAQRTVQAFHEFQYETLPHPPYSPDLSPTDNHLFRHLDHFLAGKSSLMIGRCNMQLRISSHRRLQTYFATESNHWLSDGNSVRLQTAATLINQVM